MVVVIAPTLISPVNCILLKYYTNHSPMLMLPRFSPFRYLPLVIRTLRHTKLHIIVLHVCLMFLHTTLSELNKVILSWFKLYFICIIYDKYTNNTEYDYNTTTIQMRFRRKSNDLFESASQEFTILIYVLTCRNCHLCRE